MRASPKTWRCSTAPILFGAVFLAAPAAAQTVCNTSGATARCADGTVLRLPVPEIGLPEIGTAPAFRRPGSIDLPHLARPERPNLRVLGRVNTFCRPGPGKTIRCHGAAS